MAALVGLCGLCPKNLKTPPKRDAQSFEIFSKFLADERLRRWECLFQVSADQVSYLYCGYKVIYINSARFRLHYYFLNLHLHYAVLSIIIYFTFTVV